MDATLLENKAIDSVIINQGKGVLYENGILRRHTTMLIGISCGMY